MGGMDQTVQSNQSVQGHSCGWRFDLGKILRPRFGYAVEECPQRNDGNSRVWWPLRFGLSFPATSRGGEYFKQETSHSAWFGYFRYDYAENQYRHRQPHPVHACYASTSEATAQLQVHTEHRPSSVWDRVWHATQKEEGSGARMIRLQCSFKSRAATGPRGFVVMVFMQYCV